jgi:DNA-binding response OmpR family regulator
MKKILIIDGSELLRTVLDSSLTKHGYSVSLAQNTKESYTLLDDEQFDCILVNINLDNNSGIQLIGTIRQSTCNHQALIISFLDDDDKTYEKKSYDIGSNDCMVNF